MLTETTLIHWWQQDASLLKNITN